MYEIFDRLMKERKLTPYRVSKETGVSQGSLSDWKSGRSKLGAEKLAKIADYFGVSVDYLMGREQDEVHKKIAAIEGDGVRFIRYPIIGRVAAGYNCAAIEEYTGEFEYIPNGELSGSPDDYFILRVSGNSMYPRILDGDRVLVLRRVSVDSGKVAVVLYNGEEATVKKVRYVHGENWLELVPLNPEYETKRIENSDLEQCRVLGEVIKLIGDM